MGLLARERRLSRGHSRVHIYFLRYRRREELKGEREKEFVCCFTPSRFLFRCVFLFKRDLLQIREAGGVFHAKGGRLPFEMGGRS